MVFKKVSEEIWNPEKDGDEITGKLMKIETGIGDFKSNLYKLETEAGKQLAIWGCVVLDSDMAYIQIGDKIRIVYKGTKESDGKGKQPTKIFEVFKDFPEED